MTSEVLDKIVQLMTAAFGPATAIVVFVTIRLGRLSDRVKHEGEESESS